VTGKPMAFLVARGTPKELIAFDLESKQELWRVSTDITSKVHVGGAFVTHLEGKRTLVGRDVRTGKQIWNHDVGQDPFIGVTADSQRVYYTAQDKSGDQTMWVLTALDGASGDEVWQADAPGSMGAPAARGGLVFSPFLKQWLAVLDASTGEQLTRIRGDDEEISFVRATPEDVYFGSKSGVFLLDKRAASGKRANSTYGRAKLPEEFVRVHYHWDAFDPIQSGYSAYDRNRVLWRGKLAGDKLGFANDRIVVHTYRFFFGFAAESGELAWAYSHPRVDVVASEHAGNAVGFVSMLGEIGALHAGTGRTIYSAKVEGQFLGATFDADGWQPTELLPPWLRSQKTATRASTTSSDSRLPRCRSYAVPMSREICWL
jgi:outer membrane protein assembly factor BamB